MGGSLRAWKERNEGWRERDQVMGDKIAVPEGMLKAAVDACEGVWTTGSAPTKMQRIFLEAALRWLSKNPIELTAKQFEDMSRLARTIVNGSHEASTLYHRALIRAFQVEAFLAPEPDHVTQELCGAVVIHLIAGASWFPCALLKGHEGGHRAVGNCFKHGYYLGEECAFPQCPQWPKCEEILCAPEPEMPEGVKDLLYNEHDIAPPYERHNNLIIEAERRGFLRGQKVGKI